LVGEVKQLSVKGAYWITTDGVVVHCGDADNPPTREDKDREWILVTGMHITIPTVTRIICARLRLGLESICATEAINDYTDYSWSIECVDPKGRVMNLSGGLVTDYRTLRNNFVRAYVPGWTTMNFTTS